MGFNLDLILLMTNQKFSLPKEHMNRPMSFCLRGVGVFLGLFASVMAILFATFAVPVLIFLLLWVA